MTAIIKENVLMEYVNARKDLKVLIVVKKLVRIIAIQMEFVKIIRNANVLKVSITFLIYIFNKDYFGEFCESKKCKNKCVNGICEYKTGKCLCKKGYGEDDCSKKICENNCNYNV